MSFKFELERRPFPGIHSPEALGFDGMEFPRPGLRDGAGRGGLLGSGIAGCGVRGCEPLHTIVRYALHLANLGGEQVREKPALLGGVQNNGGPFAGGVLPYDVLAREKVLLDFGLC